MVNENYFTLKQSSTAIKNWKNSTISSKHYLKLFLNFKLKEHQQLCWLEVEIKSFLKIIK